MGIQASPEYHMNLFIYSTLQWLGNQTELQRSRYMITEVVL